MVGGQRIVIQASDERNHRFPGKVRYWIGCDPASVVVQEIQSQSDTRTPKCPIGARQYVRRPV